MEPREYEILFNVEETHWWYRALRRVLFFHLNRYLPGWRGAAILDGGCGTGANLARLGPHARHVGVDKAPEAMDFCSRRGLDRVVRGDVAALPFRSATFEAVISASVLYHRWVPDVERAINECHRVLRDGGLLFLDVPAFDSLTSAHDEAVHTARRFTRRQVCKLLRAHGFEIRRISYWNALLFPLIWLVRRARFSRTGRDFERSSGIRNRLLDMVMRLEFALFWCVPLPFGVSLTCVAMKPAPATADSKNGMDAFFKKPNEGKPL